jgi:hypothetical protein
VIAYLDSSQLRVSIYSREARDIHDLSYNLEQKVLGLSLSISYS